MVNLSQYTVVIKRPESGIYNKTDGPKQKYFFKNFDSMKVVIEYISKLSDGLKVHGIHEVNIDGSTDPMTIGFNDGVLGLVYINKKDVF